MGAMTQILAMDVETVPINAIAPYPDNPRLGDRDLIASSLQANGQYRPVVVQRSTGRILAGNNTYLAAQDLGWPEIAVQYVDVDDAAARKIVAVDNRSSDAADYDNALLAELLADLEDDLDGTGYSAEEVDALIGELNTDDLPDFTAPPPTPQPAPPTSNSSALDEGHDTSPHDDTDTSPQAQEGEEEDDDTSPVPTLVQPVAEMILAFTPADRTEAAQLISSIRQALGDDLKTAEIVLRALRTLVAATDARHAPDSKITVSELLLASS